MLNSVQTFILPYVLKIHMSNKFYIIFFCIFLYKVYGLLSFTISNASIDDPFPGECICNAPLEHTDHVRLTTDKYIHSHHSFIQ